MKLNISYHTTYFFQLLYYNGEYVGAHMLMGVEGLKSLFRLFRVGV